MSEMQGGGGKIALVVLFAAIALAVAVGTLSTLPMTNHAAQGRAGTTMDAEAIRQMIDRRACKPIEVYVCPPVNQSKLMCFLKFSGSDELWAGVLVGINPPHPIITGYIAPYLEYWMPSNERDGCYRVSRID
jgi:hypothetical protein